MRSGARTEETSTDGLSRLLNLAAPAAQTTRRTRMPTQTTPASTDEVVSSMCRSYTAAVNANDSVAYAKLFTADAIRMPPGSQPEYTKTAFADGATSSFQATKTWLLQRQVSREWLIARQMSNLKPSAK
jgi:hypothetical protein